MTKRKPSVVKIEYVIISIFVLSFFIWAMAKINIGDKLKSWFSSSDPEIENVILSPADSLRNKMEELRPIYVSVDNLKLRAEPTLQGKILKTLPLNERVFFTGVVTDSTSRINIGRITADEPWVKVMHEDGTEGWLYGAGVQFYRIKNSNKSGN